MIELSGIANPAIFKKESRSTSSTSYNFIWEVDSYYPIIEYQFWFRKYKVRFRFKNSPKPWINNDTIFREEISRKST